MNIKQRELLSKYVSDVSKGLLLAGVVGYFANKISIAIFLLHLILAGYALSVAYFLEDKEND